MKKWMVYVLMVVFAVGFAVAKDKAPWWKLGFGGDDKEQITTNEAPQPPPSGRPDRENDRHRQKTSYEKQMEMKAQDEAIRSLVEAARSEIDPVKKAELTEQLRVKLTDRAEKIMKARSLHKRLEKAEVDVETMRERLKHREEEMSRRVEEQLQKLLSGEPLERGGPVIQRHRS